MFAAIVEAASSLVWRHRHRQPMHRRRRSSCKDGVFMFSSGASRSESGRLTAHVLKINWFMPMRTRNLHERSERNCGGVFVACMTRNTGQVSRAFLTNEQSFLHEFVCSTVCLHVNARKDRVQSSLLVAYSINVSSIVRRNTVLGPVHRLISSKDTPHVVG